MESIQLDMIQTAGIGALALIVGMILTRKVVDSGIVWLVQHRGVVRRHVEGCFHAGLLY